MRKEDSDHDKTSFVLDYTWFNGPLPPFGSVRNDWLIKFAEAYMDAVPGAAPAQKPGGG